MNFKLMYISALFPLFSPSLYFLPYPFPQSFPGYSLVFPAMDSLFCFD